MNIDELTIGDAKRLVSIFCPGGNTVSSTTIPRDYGIQIAVLDRGFVYVGKCRIDGDFLLIERGRNIRTWGTTKGLAELKDGPTNKTTMDACIDVRVPFRALISLIAVDEKAWKASF